MMRIYDPIVSGLILLMAVGSAPAVANPIHYASLESLATRANDADDSMPPITVTLRAARDYGRHDPVDVTVMITNFSRKSVLLNERLLVNHPVREGEIVFSIQGPDGKPYGLQRIISPRPLKVSDFAVLPPNQSVERTIDIGDMYGLRKKGLYKVRVAYRNIFEGPQSAYRAWRGVVWSDPIELKVN
jgi:hypothetical protein